jgi:endonuclease/exonuclease/phosphatase family metal-dependent hydrolase
MMNREIKADSVWFWNIHRMTTISYNKLRETMHHLRPAVVALQETKLVHPSSHSKKQYTNPHRVPWLISGYTALHQPHPSCTTAARQGGMTFYVNNNICIQDMSRHWYYASPSDSSQIEHITVTVQRHHFTIFNVYIHPSARAVEKEAQLHQLHHRVHHVLQQAGHTVLVGGDWNMTIEHVDMVKWTQGLPQLQCLNNFTQPPMAHTHTERCIDLVFVSSTALVSEVSVGGLEVTKGTQLRSDHLPVNVQLAVANPVHVSERQAWKLDGLTSKQWKQYTEITEVAAQQLSPEGDSLQHPCPAFLRITRKLRSLTTARATTAINITRGNATSACTLGEAAQTDADQVNQHLCSMMLTAARYIAERSICTSATRTAFDNTVITTLDGVTAKEQLQRVSRARRVWQHDKKCSTKRTQLLQEQKHLTLVLDQIQQHEYNKKLAAILDPKAPPGGHWRAAKAATRPPYKAPQHIKNADGQTPLSFRDSLNNAARHYATVSGHSPPHETDSDVTTDTEQWLAKIDNVTPLFTIQHLREAYRHLSRSKAEGADGIRSEFVRHLGPAFRGCLLMLFNFCYQYGVTPTQWRDAQVIMLHKVGKADLTTAESFRPISVTSVVARLMESLVMPRLTANLTAEDGKPWIRHDQAGFTKGRSTFEHLYRVHTGAVQAVSQGKRMYGIFVDIKAAYDRVWIQGLLSTMTRLRAGGKHLDKQLVLWVQSFVSKRRLRVVSDGISSEWHQLHSGLPQGSVLAPVLFNIFANTIPSVPSFKDFTRLNVPQYADDIALLVRATKRTSTAIHSTLQEYLDRLTAWANRYHVKFSVPKTQLIVFQRSGKRGTQVPHELSRHFVLQDEPIEQVSELKYLGVIFDQHMTYKPQQAAALRKAAYASHVIARLTNAAYPLDIRLMKQLVQSILISQQRYGWQFWSPNDLYYSKLVSLICTPLRHALKLPISTHRNGLLAELGMTHPMDQRWIDMHRLVSQAVKTPNTPLHRIHQIAATTPARPPKRAHHRRTVDQEVAEELKHYNISPNSSTAHVRDSLRRAWAREFRQDKYQSWYQGAAVDWHGQDLPPACHHHYLWTDARKVALIRVHTRFNRYRYLTFDQHRIYGREEEDGWCPHPPCWERKVPGTRTHMLLKCPAHAAARQQCYEQLAGVNSKLAQYVVNGMSVPFVLGTYPNMHRDIRIQCLKITGQFLEAVDSTMETMCTPSGILQQQQRQAS